MQLIKGYSQGLFKFLYPSITQPTRFWIGNRPSMLNLVFKKKFQHSLSDQTNGTTGK